MRRMRDQAARADPLAGLTGQERKILELIGEGLTNRQIGERMYLAEKPSKTTSRPCSPSSAWNAARKPPPTPPASSKTKTRTPRNTASTKGEGHARPAAHASVGVAPTRQRGCTTVTGHGA